MKISLRLFRGALALVLLASSVDPEAHALSAPDPALLKPSSASLHAPLNANGSAIACRALSLGILSDLGDAVPCNATLTAPLQPFGATGLSQHRFHPGTAGDFDGGRESDRNPPE